MKIHGTILYGNCCTNLTAYCSRSVDEILNQADFMSARNISIGLEFFKGVISADDMIEDVGSKSYETGMAVY